MKDEELIRKLNSVGKQAFVEHFDLFQNYAYGRLSRDQAREELICLGVSNDSGAAIRVGNAKLIFEANREMDALLLILDSKRIPTSVLAMARKLMQRLKSQ